MKHSSLWLTVLLLGAVPLTAAAMDYGPNGPLPAAADGTSQPSSAQTQSHAMSTLPKSGVMEANTNDTSDQAPDTPHLLRSSAPAAAPRGHEPGASDNKQRGAAPAPPTTDAGPATWQSLLPGSIQ